ncbi:hypothetical protein Pth03_62820 [Planotetraspora thailandica]|uniref:Uncharacterized protein n=1 Tax=Planotetraspora thailandica TaxID=487172 RepID=A0A8J3V729_9ACTN|nr:hypothetical protein Pth03_62820 [Planotetraspora thailandica]
MKSAATRFLVGASASAALVAIVAPISAGAATPKPPRTTAAGSDTGGDPTGADGPTVATENHGYQHTSSSSTDGTTAVQNALCRNTKVCNIKQKVIVMTPEKTIEVTPSSTPTPEPVVTEQATILPAPVATPQTAPLLSLGIFIGLNADSPAPALSP